MISDFAPSGDTLKSTRGDVREPRRRFAEIKIARAVGLEVQVVIGGVAGEDRVVVEVLVEVGLAITIEVAQARDLIAANHIHFVAYNTHAERLKESAGKTTPRDFFELVINAGHDPHLALRGADGGASVRKKIEAAEQRVRLPRIFLRLADAIHDVGPVVFRTLTLRQHRLRPERCAALCQRAQVRGRGQQCQRVIRRFVRFP
jgi:hypothetical protein